MNSSRENERAMLADMKGVHETFAPSVQPDYDWRKFKALRRMRDVKRLAGFYTTRAYTDAEHCFYTGILFKMMADAHNVVYTPEGLLWVFCHDAMEVATGDLLYPVKNASERSRKSWDAIEYEVGINYPAISEYSDENGKKLLGEVGWALFKDCDALELWLCCREERDRSNVPTNLDGSTVEATMYKILHKSQFESIRLAVAYERVTSE